MRPLASYYSTTDQQPTTLERKQGTIVNCILLLNYCVRHRA